MENYNTYSFNNKPKFFGISRFYDANEFIKEGEKLFTLFDKINKNYNIKRYYGFIGATFQNVIIPHKNIKIIDTNYGEFKFKLQNFEKVNLYKQKDLEYLKSQSTITENLFANILFENNRNKINLISMYFDTTKTNREILVSVPENLNTKITENLINEFLMKPTTNDFNQLQIIIKSIRPKEKIKL